MLHTYFATIYIHSPIIALIIAVFNLYYYYNINFIHCAVFINQDKHTKSFQQPHLFSTVDLISPQFFIEFAKYYKLYKNLYFFDDILFN